MNGDVALFQSSPLGRINAANADHADILFRNGMGERREVTGKTITSTEIGDRRSMQIAAACGLQRVIISMGIEPEHEKRTALFSHPARHAGHGSSRNRVVTAEENRHGIGTFAIGGFRQRLGPGNGFGQMMHGRVGVAKFPQRRRRHIAGIDHPMPQFFESMSKPRDTIGARPHFAAQLPGPDLQRRTNKPDIHSRPRFPNRYFH